MLIVSIDIGRKNLGYTIAKASNFKNTNIHEVIFESNVFDLKEDSRKGEIILQRVFALKKFITKIINDEVECIIIERQVPNNLIAMELMYSICSIFSNYTSNIIIFDPKLKFTKLSQIYETKNKHHKLQSINNMRKIMDMIENPSFVNMRSLLSDVKKRDDMADSFNQLLIVASTNNYFNITIEEIKEIVNE